MRGHLGEDVLLDVLEGNASREATHHATECAQCAARVAEARAGWSLASGADAPLPSPLFWEAFRGRVSSAVEAPPRRPRLAALFAPALLAAAATVAVVAFLPGREAALRSPAPLASSTAPPAEPAFDPAVGSADEDLADCPDVAACVAGLSDEESLALADALRAELASGDL